MTLKMTPNIPKGLVDPDSAPRHDGSEINRGIIK